MAPPEISSKTRGALVFSALAVLHLAFSFGVNVPGYLTYDSGTYHYMVKTFAETGGFLVDNGYEDFPSPELVIAQLKAPNGKLAAQYPEMLTILAQPFYLWLGYPGLFAINAFAFLAIALLTYLLALRLLGDRALAWWAAGLYAFATFAWEYSQSSYPHLTSTLFVLGGICLVARLLFPRPGEPVRDGWIEGLGAGLMVGIAIGLRLDSVFAAPVLLLPLFLAAPVRWRGAAGFLLGLVPPMLFLSWTNNVKFGVLSPFSYGSSAKPGEGGLAEDLGWYLPAVAAGGVLFAVLLIWRWRSGKAASLQGESDGDQGIEIPRAWLAAGVVLAAAIAGMLFPSLVAKFANGFYQIVVDLRIRPEIAEAALGRTPDGAMVYMGGVKKALLQSCPYLVLLFMPLIALGSKSRERGGLAFLFLICSPFVGVFSLLAWHGSVALNIRYLNPILPLTSILAAWTFCQLEKRPAHGRAAAFGLLSLLALSFAFVGRKPLPTQELLFLSLPLILASLLAVTALMTRLRSLRALSQAALPWLMIFAFAWSGAQTFTRDYTAAATLRQRFLNAALEMAPHIEPGSLIFTHLPDMCFGLIDRIDDIYIARPENDNYESFPHVARHFLGAGRSVYTIVSPRLWQRVSSGLAAQGFEPRVLTPLPAKGPPLNLLVELRLLSTPAQPPG